MLQNIIQCNPLKFVQSLQIFIQSSWGEVQSSWDRARLAVSHEQNNDQRKYQHQNRKMERNYNIRSECQTLHSWSISIGCESWIINERKEWSICNIKKWRFVFFIFCGMMNIMIIPASSSKLYLVHHCSMLLFSILPLFCICYVSFVFKHK